MAYSRKKKHLRVPAILLISFSFTFLACTGESDQIKRGYFYINSGDFDAALTEFQNAFSKNPDNPDILAGLGLVLSFENVSIFSSIEMLEKSLQIKSDDHIRWELLQLYLDLGYSNEAEKLLAPYNLPVERNFSKEIAIAREGVRCFAFPGNKAALNLSSKFEGDLCDFFLARCYLSAKNTELNTDKAKDLLKKIRNKKLSCELLASFPANSIQTQFDLKKMLSNCRRSFPGLIRIQRERGLPLLGLDTTKARKIFPEDPYLTPDPPRLIPQADENVSKSTEDFGGHRRIE